jgi:hypothetical protein
VALTAAFALAEQFDPFDLAIEQPRPAPRAPSVRAKSNKPGRVVKRTPAPQQPTLRAPYRTENPWRAGDHFAEPANESQARSRHSAKRAVRQAAYVDQTTQQNDQSAASTTEEIPNPANTGLIEGEWTEDGWVESDVSGVWDEGCYGCGDPACGCGDACTGCGDACQCGGACHPCSATARRTGRVQYGDFAFYGWLAQGVTINPDDPNNRFNGPLTFNDRANEYQLNQLYVAFEDVVDRCGCAWDIGGRVDLLYGTDYFFVEAAGLETRRDGTPRWNSGDGPRDDGSAALYGFAMPQLYAEVFAPVGSGLSVKMGHFYSIVGYESVMYPQNFFYSHSYAKQYGEPFTHTGLLADYRLGGNWTLLAGFTRGWNNWEDVNGELAFLGGLEWCRPDGRESLRFALHTGSEDDLGENNRTVYSLVYYRCLPGRSVYVLEHNFGVEDNAATRGNDQVPAHWYGISQYFVQQINCETEVGLRVEWFRDEENARVLGIPLDGGEGGNYVGVSLGANIYPSICNGLQIRPELRWDWSDTEFQSLGVQGMFDDFTDDDQLTIAVSAGMCF